MVWCSRRRGWRVSAAVIAFLCVLVSLPSRDGHRVLPSTKTANFVQTGNETFAATLPPVRLTPDDVSSAAATHYTQAQRALRQGQWAHAQIESERALTQAETFHPASATETERVNHLAAFRQYNEFYVNLLMRQHQRQPGQGWAARAWEANERAHWYRWRQTMQGMAGSPQPTASKITFKEILAAVQMRLRQQNSLLLEYALGERRSYLWMLDGTEITAYVLPGRSIIERQTQLVYQQLSQPLPASQAQPDQPALRQLSEILLRPVQHALQGDTRRLLVVSDGNLQQVPFSVLAQPVADKAGQLVLTQREITNLPAALVLLEDDGFHKAFADGVAVVADPVFGKHDERVTKPETAQWALPGISPVTRFQPVPEHDAGVVFVPRLPFARYEAENVARWFAPLMTLRATGFAANRQLALDGSLKKYPVIHFATHGYSDKAHPEQSGLVLSRVNERGDAQEGLLQLRDICRLHLPAELVVLSACESGLAKASDRFTPAASLAEGFLFAGAHRVISTLWPVNDAATAELMRHFYAGLLGDQHLAPAAALRQAQLALARDARWRHPYYWAAFMLQGEH